MATANVTAQNFVECDSCEKILQIFSVKHALVISVKLAKLNMKKENVTKS